MKSAWKEHSQQFPETLPLSPTFFHQICLKQLFEYEVMASASSVCNGVRKCVLTHSPPYPEKDDLCHDWQLNHFVQ